ncbi:uncharacterized protein LOC107263718 [Cephus cinctus]|uniref:Uncharacterized protein LOC107263718 n=1 Tax=Cephus cinctus TaxID=211228 RepID=A0AAJ7R9P8_CEPCN|nr:uncharacterized protein LOC107263718 [Cephus cinctus]
MSNHLSPVTITMSDNLKLDALKYLIDTGHLNKCKILASQHSEKSQGIGIANLPFIYDLEIDLILLNDSSHNLYEKFVQYPEKTRNIFRDVIQEEMIKYLTCNKCRPVHTELHIHCTILPHISKIRNIKPTALILLKRYVLTAMTVAVTYSICKFYRCTNTFCIRNLMGFYLTEEDVQMEEWKKCELCYQSVIEDQARSGEGQRVLVNFIPITGFRSHKPGMHRAITCSVTESLIKKLELGSEYHICGYQKTQWFEILGLEKYNPFGIKYEPYVWPSTILSLKSMIDQTHPNSPWAFVMFLASQLGHSICPSKSSLSLKMGLLLSLSNLNGNKVVPVMCVGPSTKIAAELMNHTSKFAERHLRNGFPIVGFIKEIGNWTWQESGILIMAKNGVCNLGNWEGLKQSEREVISSTIGANKIKVNTKCVKGFGTIPIYSLKTAIWTYWGYSRSERHNSMVKKCVE